MKTKHYIAVGVALVLVVVLAMMPKAVLRKNGAEPQAARDEAAKPDAEGQNAAVQKAETSHAQSLSTDQVAKIAQWRTEWLSATSQTKTAAAKAWTVDSMAMVFTEVGLYDSAATYRAQLAKLVPTAVNQQKAGDVYYDAATLALNEDKRKNYQASARKWYDAALKTDPKNLDSKAKLALTYVDSDNPMQGILMLREVVTTNPNHELATYNLGIFAMQTKQYDKAIGRFEQLTKINAKDPKGWFYLGLCQKELGNLAEAKKSLTQAKSVTKDPAVLASIDDVLKDLEAPVQ